MNLANLAYEAGDDASAEAFLQEALEARVRTYGADHPETWQVVTNMANVVARRGDRGRAEDMARRAVAALEARRDAREVLVAALQTLTAILVAGGRTSEAIPVHGRAVALVREVYGPAHLETIQVLTQAARTYAREGLRDRAIETAVQAARASAEVLDAAASGLAEQQALETAIVRAVGVDPLLDVLLERGSTSEDASIAWDALVRSRALVLDAVARRHRVASSAEGDAEAAARRDALARASRRLARLLVGAPVEESARAAAVSAARAERDAAERALAGSAAARPDEAAWRRVGGTEVARALPPRSALLSFVSHRMWTGSGTGPGALERGFVAFVVRPMGEGRPEPAFVPLGAASEIDAAVSRWRRSIVARGDDAASIREEREAGDALRRAVWDPVAPLVRGADRIFVVPDGSLGLVNLSALPTGPAGDGATPRYLVEEHAIHVLATERELAVTPGPRGRGLLALGGALHDAAPHGSAAGQEPEGSGTSAALRGAAEGGPCASLEGVRFADLPGSAGEAATTARLWRELAAEDATELLGAAATEPALARLAPGRRVLHLATHGFVLDGECDRAPAGSRGLSAPAPSAPGLSPRTALGLSGLTLAGANRRAEAGASADDGILTSEEITVLDLAGCEWAVLSACDTGLGTVQASEGVLGLRRAFRVAGARTVITSLWPVEDGDARRWMDALYRARLERGLDTASCVREASLALLRERRARGEGDSPRHWAAFVAAGDWR